MRRIASVSAVVILVLFVAASASADTLYTNGGPIANHNHADNYGAYKVTDSFVLSVPSTLGSATIYTWVTHGDTPTTLTWGISATSFGNDLGSGTASGAGLNESLYCSFSATCGNAPSGTGEWDVWQETFSLSNLNLGAGNYWFTLSNGNTAANDYVFWDENSGPSTAFMLVFGNPLSVPSHAFTIYGPESVVPEPSSVLLVATGLIGALGALRRKLHGYPRYCLCRAASRGGFSIGRVRICVGGLS